MAYRVNSRGVLHSVMLPQSWFINFILPGTDLGKDTSAFSMFASTMMELMRRIDAQAQGYQAQGYLMSTSDAWEQFIADGSRMTSFTGSLYVARM